LVIIFFSTASFLVLRSFIVDKIVIAQQSLQAFINELSPGAYSFITKVNFKILDNFLLKPIGVYGSKEEIVRFLREIHAVNDDACVCFPLSYQANFRESSARKLLMSQNGSRGPGTDLEHTRSGLYIVRSFVSTAEEQAYVLYWPEDTTWDDEAVSTVQRNRVTFMRYYYE
jgi:hypothetical protein